MNQLPQWRRALLGLTMLCLAAGIASAQLTTYEVRDGVVLAVQGNLLTVRGPEGVKQFDIPESFRFDMAGKKLSVHELKPGMKITAVITTVQTPVTMTSTEYREAEVVNVAAGSVVIRNEAGELKQYTAKDVKAMDIVILRNDEPVTIYDLRKGDRIAATIVSQLPPQTMTESELKVYVQNAPPPPPAPSKSAAPAKPAAPAAPMVATLPKTGSPLPWIGLAGLVALGAAIVLTGIRRFHA